MQRNLLLTLLILLIWTGCNPVQEPPAPIVYPYTLEIVGPVQLTIEDMTGLIQFHVRCVDNRMLKEIAVSATFDTQAGSRTSTQETQYSEQCEDGKTLQEARMGDTSQMAPGDTVTLTQKITYGESTLTITETFEQRFRKLDSGGFVAET
jgi:hypothetical protein